MNSCHCLPGSLRNSVCLSLGCEAVVSLYPTWRAPTAPVTRRGDQETFTEGLEIERGSPRSITNNSKLHVRYSCPYLFLDTWGNSLAQFFSPSSARLFLSHFLSTHLLLTSPPLCHSASASPSSMPWHPAWPPPCHRSLIEDHQPFYRTCWSPLLKKTEITTTRFWV